MNILTTPEPTSHEFALLLKRGWRVCNLYTILDSKGKLVAFDPNTAQRQFYNAMWYLNHILKSRKMGFSTEIEILNFDDLMFIGGLVAGIVDKTLPDAKKKLRMVKLAFDKLDDGDIHPRTWKLGKWLKKWNPIISRSTEELVFKNGSTFYCSVSPRGGTTNRLHISELGYTAHKFPEKAEEIVNGALNSFTPGNRCDIETTHEGGKIGANYRLMRKAMGIPRSQLTEVDFLFHFYAWFIDSRYSLNADFPIRPEIQEYFSRLSREIGQSFTHGQMLWYDRKEAEQGYGMKKEFPSTPGEAFEAIVEGAIYGKQMADARAQQRILDFGLYADRPIYTFSDIGLSDYLSTWLIQETDRHTLVLDWMEWEGLPGTQLNDKMKLWERKWDKPISGHFLPHDVAKRSPNDAKSYHQVLTESGMKDIVMVPRIADVGIGIGYVRDILPHCYFNKRFCDQPRTQDGEEFPSGVACLEGYSKNKLGKPEHNEFSHSADAFRTYAEARILGLIRAPGQSDGPPPKAVGGHSRSRAPRATR